MKPVDRLVVFAPNWLGDVVMSLPCFDALRREFPSATVAVAARRHLAPLFEMVQGVGPIVALEPPGALGGWLAAARDGDRLASGRFDLAVLLPNSFRAAWIARRARIGERWGYAADGRRWLLTRAVPRVRGGHQVEYYRRLLGALGIATGAGNQPGRPEAGSGIGVDRELPLVSMTPPDDARKRARAKLFANGWTPGDRLVGMAPGAAYGSAKQWPPERFAALTTDLTAGGVRVVVVGSQADRPVCDAIEQAVRGAGHVVINLAGQTDLCELAAVMAECGSFVSNDSGAMHLAAATGVPVTAIFGSTREWETSPLRHPSGAAHAIVHTDAWCRPCMRRECPFPDHACMTGIGVERVKSEVVAQLASMEAR